MDPATPISNLKGVGSRREQVLKDSGISTVRDLLYFFPRRHLNRISVSPIRNLTKGDIATLVGQVETFGEKSTHRGRRFQVILSDGTGILTLNWFNGIQFIRNLFKVDDQLAVHGKVDWYNGFSMSHPEFDKLDQDMDPISSGAIIPLYPLTQELRSAGIEQRVLRRMIKDILSQSLDIEEIFSESVLSKYDLVFLDKALNQIHFSSGIGDLNVAKKRLKFDEHFFLQLLMALRKRNIQHTGTEPLPDIGPYFKSISDSIGFELTKAQKRVIKEIHTDLKKSVSMNRLLQGDVGSGKTIVAVLISALTVGNSAQVAIMAPTEILATQHFNSFKTIFDKVSIPVALLVGNMKKGARNEILEGLEAGKIPIVIGTHALIQDDVNFKNLGLVVVDEQHRFGVNQRAKLLGKSVNPHFLAMTATPIPRTLAITYYGDMDLSIIDEMPANRIPVVTKVVEPSRMIKVYKFIEEEVDAGYKCMVIYPLVEESEKLDLAAAVEAHQELDEKIFPNISVGLIHGRMKTEEKDAVMNKFANNEISILVSTTVVEVGVDIPNATIMVIEHAERFGLTQLHQLRGRVGRGTKKSYCILVERNVTETSKTRLSIMEKTSDGFVIADEDLKLRGPGEFIGVKQSGFFKYKIANMITDGPIIRDARQAAFDLVENDPNLKDDKHCLIREIFLNDYAKRLENITLS